MSQGWSLLINQLKGQLEVTVILHYIYLKLRTASEQGKKPSNANTKTSNIFILLKIYVPFLYLVKFHLLYIYIYTHRSNSIWI